MSEKHDLSPTKRGKSLKKKTNGNGNNELPNDILCLILSYFTVREAANASLVSRQWRHLCASMSNLVFDWNSMLQPHKDHCTGTICQGIPCRQCMDKFVRGVNQYIQSYKGERVVSFTVEFILEREHYACDINRWVSFAVDMGVERLVLSLRHRRFSPDNLRSTWEDLSMLRYEFFSHGNKPKLKHLSLASCILGPGVIELFSCLKFLTFSKVPLGQQEVESILSSCLKLESMKLRICLLPPKLCIFGSVKDLEFMLCHEVKEIELSAPNLTSFCYSGCMIKFSFSRVSNLKKVRFRIPAAKALQYVFSQVAKDHPHLETLQVYSVANLKQWLPERLTPFTNVKKLEFSSFVGEMLDVQKIIAVLNACPLLEKFHLKIRPVDCEGRMDLPPESVHKHLKEVFFDNFYFNTRCFKFAIYMLEYAVSLGQLTIKPTPSMNWHLYMKPWDAGEHEEARLRLKNHLKRSLIVVLND